MQKNIVKDFNVYIHQENKELANEITALDNDDSILFKSFMKQGENDHNKNLQIKFENSFEYIRIYFNVGRYIGFKFHDGENLIIFAIEKKKRPKVKMFKPLGPNFEKVLSDLISLLNSYTNSPIQMVCLDSQMLKRIKKRPELVVKNIKEFNYYIYDLSTLNNLKGNAWKNVRQKISTFEKNNPKLKTERLTSENLNDVIHFIGTWRRQLISKRGISYSNIEKNKDAANYYSNNNDLENIWAMVLRLSGRVVALQLLYRLNENSAAHAIGLADNSVKGLSEFTQIDIWQRLINQGIKYINDGPSWRLGLERYKRKFNPISAQKVYECKIQSK